MRIGDDNIANNDVTQVDVDIAKGIWKTHYNYYHRDKFTQLYIYLYKTILLQKKERNTTDDIMNDKRKRTK